MMGKRKDVAMATLDRTKLGISAALALAAACSTQGAGTAGGPGGAGTTTTGSGPGGATSSSTHGAMAATAVSSTGGPMAFVCDPPAAPGSIFEAKADSFGDVLPVPMCKYRGDVLLIVNTAAL